MKCPQCSREMEPGFVQWDASKNLTWVSKLMPLGLAYWKEDAVDLSPYSVQPVPPYLQIIPFPLRFCMKNDIVSTQEASVRREAGQ